MLQIPVPGTNTWEWDFNNTDSNTFTPTAFTKTAATTYTSENTYYIKLRVTDPAGCVGERRQPVTIRKNKATISSSDGIYGCQTLTTTFSATSTNPLTLYRWTFSDDGTQSSDSTPTHTFLERGNYTASLYTETLDGCSDTAVLKILIGGVPNFDFNVTTPANGAVVCGNNKVTFTVTGTDMQGKFYWNFGDTKDYVLINGGGPKFTHQYNTDSIYTVSLAIDNNGCTDTIVKQNYVTVLPPFPNVSTLSYDCNDRTKVIVKETTKKTDLYKWDFGDGTDTTYTTALPQLEHHYARTGKYKVVLTASYEGCVVKDSAYAYILNKQKPVLTTPKTMLCLSDSLQTTISGMEASPYLYSPTVKDYTVKSVEYQDGSPFTGIYSYPDDTWQNPFHVNISQLRPGEKILRIITNSRGFNCADTTNFVNVHINGPEAGFMIENNIACLSDNISFVDTSKGDSTYPINKWEWSFGDSTFQTLTTTGNTTHKYTLPGNYDIKLAITDGENCTDTAYYPAGSLTIKGPKARFSMSENPILPNNDEIFTNLTDSGNIPDANNSYTWIFGDGESLASNETKVSHMYPKYSDDTVRLVASNSETGCSDTAMDVLHIKNTDLSFTYTTTNLIPNSNCPPVLVNFTNTSLNFEVVSWSFGDGTTADNLNTPSHKYDKPGDYKVTIYGYYNSTTFDSTWEYITIYGPRAIVHADVLKGCGSREVTFSAETKDATDYTWDFGDGNLLDTQDSIVSYTYTHPDVYEPSLTVNNGPKCSFSYFLNTTLIIDSMHLSIKTDSMLLCHEIQYNFAPEIVSVAKDKGQPINYTWHLSGMADSLKTENASTIYNTSGVYNISLIAVSPYGCVDTAHSEVIYTSADHVKIIGPTEICENTPVTFQAKKVNEADIINYNWQLQDMMYTVQNPPAHQFSATGNDTVKLIVEDNGCLDTIYHKMIIHRQPKVALQMSDSVICLGGAIFFNAQPDETTALEPIDYFWNLGTGKDSAAVQSAWFTYSKYGKYPVVMRATSTVFGCQIQLTDTAIIASAPRAGIKAPVEICVGSSATLMATSGVEYSGYEWHFSDQTISTDQNPEPKFYSTAGVDSIYMVANVGSCRDTARHTLIIHELPTVNLLPEVPRICLGDSIQLTAHNGIKYTWQSAGNISSTTVADPYVFPATDTKYAVQVTDMYGCKNTDSAIVLVTQPMKLTTIPVVNVCAGNRATLSASGTDVFTWINGDDLTATNIARPTTLDSAQNKTYVAIGSDQFGCFTDTATVDVIVRERPEVDAGADVVAAAGVPVQLAATATGNIISWSWDPALNLSCSNCAAPVSRPRQSTRYTVTATNNYGCKNSDTVAVSVVCKESLLNVPEVFSPNGDGKNDRFRITTFGVKSISHLVIFSRNGNRVFERNNVSPLDIDAAWDGMYNSSMMPAGTYVYVLQVVCDAGEVYNMKGTITLVR